MRFPSRLPPIDDSPVPGVIPGKVHVHDEPTDQPAPRERPVDTPSPHRTREFWRFRRGHRF